MSNVNHITFIGTTEVVIEAATGTIAANQYVIIYPKPVNFTVDHPFVFIILYKIQTLFMEKVKCL